MRSCSYVHGFYVHFMYKYIPFMYLLECTYKQVPREKPLH